MIVIGAVSQGGTWPSAGSLLWLGILSVPAVLAAVCLVGWLGGGDYP